MSQKFCKPKPGVALLENPSGVETWFTDVNVHASLIIAPHAKMIFTFSGTVMGELKMYSEKSELLVGGEINTAPPMLVFGAAAAMAAIRFGPSSYIKTAPNEPMD